VHSLRWFLLLVALLAAPVYAEGVVRDGEGGAAPLADAGDADRGRALLLARDRANCILCHGLSDPAVKFAGNLGPALDGAGARLTPARLRARIVDSARINPATIMPSYFKTEGLTEVATPYRGKTILAAQEVEDLVAYLSRLK
jgi:sulfur-oxidizing protein SoxX